MPRITSRSTPLTDLRGPADLRSPERSTTPSATIPGATFEGRGSLSAGDAPVPGQPGAVLATRLAASRGAMTGARAGVATLYQTYGIGDRFERPQERILTWVGYLQEKLQGANGAGGAGALTGFIVEKDLRRQIFLLEGILKLYKKPHPELKPHFEAVKQLEDTIGTYTGLKGLAGTLAEAGGVPQEIRDHVAHERDAALGKLEQLVTDRWQPRTDGKVPVFEELLGTLADLEWAAYDDDRLYVAAKLRDELEEMREIDYDMADLQGDVGMHELRRDLRWFPIFVEALDGLVVLDDSRNPNDAYTPLLETELARSKFLKLPPPDLDRAPMKISKSLYAAMMQGVLDLGKLKDEREAIEGLGHALQALGKAEDRETAEALAEKMLGRSPEADEELTARAQAFYDGMVKNKLLRDVRRDLKEYDV